MALLEIISNRNVKTVQRTRRNRKTGTRVDVFPNSMFLVVNGSSTQHEDSNRSLTWYSLGVRGEALSDDFFSTCTWVATCLNFNLSCGRNVAWRHAVGSRMCFLQFLVPSMLLE